MESAVFIQQCYEAFACSGDIFCEDLDARLSYN